MENALWNGKRLLAAEIAEDYSLEKGVRKASGRKELRCPDPECQHPVLRYCHGEVKDAYFAHCNNDSCDYAVFDKENTQIIRTIRRVIYESFKKNGYHVQPEVKILSHHYTQLLFDMEDGRQIAVEIGTQRLSANKIDRLTDEYNEENIAVKWIVVGNTDKPLKENQTFFLKRYQLNESKNKDLLVVSWDGTKIGQYKIDPNLYEYNGRILYSENYPDTYTEYATLDNLTFEGDELSLTGFHKRYEAWLNKKRAAFNKKIIQLKEERLKRLEKTQCQTQEKNRLYSEQKVWCKSFSQPTALASTYVSQCSLASPKKTYEQLKEEILPLIGQQQKPARDSTGKRWVKCEKCGRIGTDEKFVSYGGVNHVNLGLCCDCGGSRKPTK